MARKTKNEAEEPPFEVGAFLDSGGVSRKVVKYRRGQTVFRQGDPAQTVLYLQRGGVKLSVVSRTGKAAVVAILGPGDFFGEGALSGAAVRLGNATAMEPTSVLVVEKDEMMQRLHDHPAFSARFIAHLLARNSRIEADLVDQLFNSSEKRLARALLMLARYGKSRGAHTKLPRISQEVLAEMVGTTRSRVNFFMNKFRKLGFIEYNGDIRIHSSLLDVVLHD